MTPNDVEFPLFMAILDYQMLARMDLCMFLGLIIWKLSSLEIPIIKLNWVFYSVEMTDDS